MALREAEQSQLVRRRAFVLDFPSLSCWCGVVGKVRSEAARGQPLGMALGMAEQSQLVSEMSNL